MADRDAILELECKAKHKLLSTRSGRFAHIRQAKDLKVGWVKTQQLRAAPQTLKEVASLSCWV